MVELLIVSGDALFFPHHHMELESSFSLPSTTTRRRINCPGLVSRSLHAQRCFCFQTTSISSRNKATSLMGIRASAPGNLLRCCSNENALISSGNIAIIPLSLLREIGLNERDSDALLDSNPALRFTPREHIYTRIRSLQALGVGGLSLYRLILKRPDILTAEEIDSFLNFLLRSDDLGLPGKLEPAQIERLLNSTEPRFLLGFEEKVRLLLHHGIPQDKLAHVLNQTNLTKALCNGSVQEIDRKFAFLNRFGGVDIILKRPAILNYDLDGQLIPRIGFLLELSRGDEDATGTLLRKLPFLVAYSVEHLSNHVEFLKSFAGLSDQEIFRIALVYPNLFSASRERKLYPRIDFLKQCGLNSNEIFRFLVKAPLFISLSFEANLAHKLVFLVKLGYKSSTKDLATAMGSVTRTSCKNLQEVIGVFFSYGLNCEDILEMSKKHPQVLQYNYESLEEKLNYLVEEMGRDVGELLAFPAFLGYKLDRRIKHRYEVRKKISGEGMSLNKLLSVSAARFSMRNKEEVVNNPSGSDD